MQHDFVGFYQEEIEFRKALDYPPFARLINFRLAGNSEKTTQAAAEALGRLGDALVKRNYRKGIEILGPSVAPFPKMRGRYRFHMLAKGKNSRWLHQFARNLILQSEDLTKGKGVTLEVDVDPVFIL
jgi:primosomal protein N' (replication factor Y)